MLDAKTQELAAQVFSQILGGWSASGRPLPKDGHAEAQLAITYARSFQAALMDGPPKP